MSIEPRIDLLGIGQLRDLNDRAAAEGAVRARCHVVPVDAETALCRVLGRWKFYVDLRDTGMVPHLLFEGLWRYWVTGFVWRNVAPGETAVDVGANHGYYAALMAELVGPEGRVHAFEPNPRLHALLRRNLALNGLAGRVAASRSAAGARAGEMTLVVPVQDPKAAWVAFEDGRPAPPADDPAFQRHQVAVAALDALVEGPADFVKVDCEGGEEAIWAGMQGLIRRSPGVRILFEVNPARCRDPGRLLDTMAGIFPLRAVAHDGRAAECSASDVLGRGGDTVLYLSHADPR